MVLCEWFLDVFRETYLVPWQVKMGNQAQRDYWLHERYYIEVDL